MASLENSGDTGGGMNSEGRPVSLEAENARLRAEIEFLKKRLQIVGSVTRHDVLNQLTAIVGYNELLGMIIEDEKEKSYLERERIATEKIRRLFMFSKDYQNIAAGSPRWQNLVNVMHRVREALDNPAIKITVTTGNTAVYADPLLDKALLQLCENTVRHGGAPTEIHVTLQQDGPRVLLVIEDNGSGIAAAEKERIFERGYGKGTGWGLFLVREILGITGITITENSETGKGARFVITLPEGTFHEGGDEEPSMAPS